ncbi:sulfurtransferase TusA family protein [Vallitaleaceae bacterium 9-2]
MYKVDCFGDFCPVPLIKAEKTFEKLAVGESFMLCTDHSCVVESVHEYFKNRQHKIIVDEVLNGVWEITIMRTH